MEATTTAKPAIASPAGSPTRYAVLGGQTRAVEFTGYRYDWSTGQPVASEWVLTDSPEATLSGVAGFLFPKGQRVELVEADLVPLVLAINLPAVVR